MRTSTGTVAAVACLLALTACSKAQTPGAVQRDVGKADQSAVQDIAAAEQKKDAKIAEANADVAITRAEGDHQIAVAQCEALTADAQKACNDRADSTLEMAKANAKAAKAE